MFTKSLVQPVLSIDPEGKGIKPFGTMTVDIIAPESWIKSKGVRHIAIEITGAYWKTLYNPLDVEQIKALVINT